MMNLDLSDIFNKIKKSKWSKPIYISLTIAASILLFLIGSCFALLLTGLFIFAIPYLFGERSAKTMIKVGLIIILLIGIIIGVLSTYCIHTQSSLGISGYFNYESDYVSDNKSILINGHVEPYLGGENTIYNYTVEYNGTEGSILWVNITLIKPSLLEYYGKSVGNYTLTKGAENVYYNDNITLEIQQITYIYHFSAWNGTEWIETSLGGGPVNAPLLNTLSTIIILEIRNMFMNVGLIFFLILLLYWWTRKAKIERMKWGEEPAEEGKQEEKKEDEKIEEAEQEEKDVGYTCTDCGAEVSTDTVKCPKCGAKFEGFEED
jgi:ribosomal protein L40E